jgi:hypothetical protein
MAALSEKVSYRRSRIPVMDSRHWWNGRWGRLARRDVFACPSEGRWAVELRRGGEGGRSRTRTFGSEREALAWIEAALLEADGGWREVDAARSRKVAALVEVVT